MRKILQLAMLAAGVALTVGSVSACSDDSTATAPITSNPVTTTAMYSSPSSSGESADASSEASAPAATPSDETGSRSLPATAANTRTSVPQNFPGPNGQPVTDKGKKYLAALKSQRVEFMGDTDNNIALTMAEYICSERKKGTDPITVKAYVTASVGPGTKTVAEANTKADKVIKAADDNYC
ncbi:DUF732 domain-containing protein [Gordonia soli]|uniref:DUF732 domain-containing protein n=1 Tax=Gordonia soli NBRC 108243 TaxID=1223545 RepID=M0QRA0_9ACTN|nr:DUF732 domain-containing protein [Gordonia soli]GAC70944.1 hypothetical protein GS4_44_00260 [Gordonia soli NBRC 108243]